MSAGDEAARTSAVVAGVLEPLFATVDGLQEAALDALGAPRRSSAVTLDEQVRALLEAPGQLAVGLGLVATVPGRVLLRWWQVDPDTEQLRALDPDLDPGSVGYYDCTAADWFAVPQRTGRRHVVGPYVDVHGTGCYLLTLTSPVELDGRFVGVVGADVPVDRFEDHLLDLLGPGRQPFVLVDDDGRVVLSTASRWLVGDLVPAPPAPGGARRAVPGLPWELHVVPEQPLEAMTRRGSCP